MRSPHTYAEWVEVIDTFGNRLDDDGAISAMRSGTLDWQAGVSDRFLQKLIGAVNKRMNAAVDAFQKRQRRSVADERSITEALLAFRREFITLMNAVDIPAMPEKYREECRSLIRGQADANQSSLEDSAPRVDRSGKLLSIIHKTPVNKF